jgi:hypothetical protein
MKINHIQLPFEPVMNRAFIPVTPYSHLLEGCSLGQIQEQWKNCLQNSTENSRGSGKTAYHCGQGLSGSGHSACVLGVDNPNVRAFSF